MKKVIRLTESDLHKLVKESVKRILNENMDWNSKEYLLNDKKTSGINVKPYSNNTVLIDNSIQPFLFNIKTQQFTDEKGNVINPRMFNDSDASKIASDLINVLRQNYNISNAPIHWDIFRGKSKAYK